MRLLLFRYVFLILLISAESLFSLTLSKVEPPNWWQDMETDTVSLLFYGDDFTGYSARSTGNVVEILEGYPYPNSSYYHLSVKILKSGKETITFFNKNSRKHKPVSVEFPVYERSGKKPLPIDQCDVIYLLIPDRFSDGNADRNFIPNHNDPIRPNHPWGRRGGDLEGVINHVNYLNELGITVLWMTPVFENNYLNCYHGYTPTDLYEIDPHLGDFDDYQHLVTLCQEHGIKVIMDHIVNHIAPSHPLAVNPPSPEWINYSTNDFVPCNYRIFDIINAWGLDSLRQIVQSGWFAGYLADMNLQHKPVVDYWIMHAIWWIEKFGLDGIRQDTWPYSDTDGTRKWVQEVRREYPTIFILGETMVFDKTPLSYFFSSREDLQNGLSSVTDFAHSNQIFQITKGQISLKTFYEQLSMDFIYREPEMMTVFMDNHDMRRFFTDVEEDIHTYLNAFILLYGLRGIPQLYYGDELGMSGGHDPENRKEFPGGFPDNPRSAFRPEERTETESLLITQFQRLNQHRQEYPTLYKAPLKHHLINDSLYTAWHQDDKNLLFLSYNTAKTTLSVQLKTLLPNLAIDKNERIAPLYSSEPIFFDSTKAILFIPPHTALMWHFSFKKDK